VPVYYGARSSRYSKNGVFNPSRLLRGKGGNIFSGKKCSKAARLAVGKIENECGGPYSDNGLSKFCRHLPPLFTPKFGVPKGNAIS